jgi:hypothetical protein
MSNLSKRFPLYSKLLVLYPKGYRKQYKEQLLQTTADMLDDAATPLNKIAIWTRVAIDLPVNVFQTQLQYVGGIMWNETPHYIKRNSLIGMVMLLPFMASLVANSLDKVINNHTLYNSWLWKLPFSRLWVLWLPESAFLLMLGTYIYFLIKENKTGRSGFIKRIFNIKHSWPIIVPGILAFGVLFILAFHDSVQCWVHSPSYATSHLSQEWSCTTRNQSLKGFRNNF